MENVILPSFVLQFLSTLKLRNKSKVTIKNYEFDLKHFFAFLCEHREDPEIFHELTDSKINFVSLPPTPSEITLDELEKVTHWHIQSYLSWIKDERNLGPRTLSRIQATIRSLYSFLTRKDLIQVNVSKKLDPIEIPKEDVIAMEPNEVADLTEALKTGKLLTDKQLKYHKHTLKRDLAIFQTLIGSGLRLMELQQLNLDDIDFNKRNFHIIGKGGKIVYQPFSKVVAVALQDYCDNERDHLKSKGIETQAVFLSLQGKRMSRRAIQNLVEKYMRILREMGHKTDAYTTHKLRATCATHLLRETNNLALVQDFMRHEDPKTTRKYTKVTDEELRRAADLIKFE